MTKDIEFENDLDFENALQKASFVNSKVGDQTTSTIGLKNMNPNAKTMRNSSPSTTRESGNSALGRCNSPNS